MKPAPGIEVAIRHLHEGELSQAEKICRRILAEEPGHGLAYQILGSIALRLKQWESAEIFLRRAISIQPDLWETYYDLAAALQELGKLDDAKNAFARAVQLKPDYLNSPGNLDFVFKESGSGAESPAQMDLIHHEEPDRGEDDPLDGGKRE